jgi:hypothetical protein
MTDVSPAQAVARTYMNRADISASVRCGCYSCLRLFEPSEIRLWADSTDPGDHDPGALRPDGARFQGFTAVCPYCEDTSVLGDASVGEFSEALLERVHAYWSKEAK